MVPGNNSRESEATAEPNRLLPKDWQDILEHVIS
jgi:hypothetical protein